MIKIYGYSDDLVEIEGSNYEEDEIDCFDKDVEIEFEDGTKILVGYNKPNMGVWYIEILNLGTGKPTLEICEDENAVPYSDVFTIDSEIISHRVVPQKRRLED